MSDETGSVGDIKKCLKVNRAQPSTGLMLICLIANILKFDAFYQQQCTLTNRYDVYSAPHPPPSYRTACSNALHMYSTSLLSWSVVHGEPISDDGVITDEQHKHRSQRPRNNHGECATTTQSFVQNPCVVSSQVDLKSVMATVLQVHHCECELQILRD